MWLFKRSHWMWIFGAAARIPKLTMSNTRKSNRWCLSYIDRAVVKTAARLPNSRILCFRPLKWNIDPDLSTQLPLKMDDNAAAGAAAAGQRRCHESQRFFIFSDRTDGCKRKLRMLKNFVIYGQNIRKHCVICDFIQLQGRNDPVRGGVLWKSLSVD